MANNCTTNPPVSQSNTPELDEILAKEQRNAEVIDHSEIRARVDALIERVNLERWGKS